MVRTFLERSTKSLIGLIGLGSLLNGIFVLPFGINDAVQIQRFRKLAHSTNTISINQVTIPNTNHASNIIYRYSVNNKIYQSHQSGPAYSEPLGVQSVLYDPKNPSISILANSQFTNENMSLGISIFFIGIGTILLFLQNLLASNQQRKRNI